MAASALLKQRGGASGAALAVRLPPVSCFVETLAAGLRFDHISCLVGREAVCCRHDGLHRF